MTQIGLFYGSSTSNTEYIAYDMQDMVNQQLGQEVIVVHNVGDTDFQQMLQYKHLILGIPTWDVGELQADWDIKWSAFRALDFSGRKVAVFGLGDQYGYPDTFLDAAGIVAEAVLEQGGEVVGYTATTGYEFDASLFVEDDQFMGLALDEDQQHDLSDGRIRAWIPTVLAAFGMQQAAASA